MQKRPSSLRVRIIWGALVLLALCSLGGFASIHSSRPEVPQPWGSVRHMYFSTNKTATLAHFRFKSNFPFDVLNEVTVETKTINGWHTPRGPFAFQQLSPEVKAGNGQEFSVKVPANCEAWRVVVRSYKSTLSPADERREKLRVWLQAKGAVSLAERLRVEDPGSYDTPGPEMELTRMGQLARPR